MSNQDYAEMIEMPVSTYETFVKPKKPVKGKKSLFKLFATPKKRENQTDFCEGDSEDNLDFENYEKQPSETFLTENENPENFENTQTVGKKGRFKWDLVTAQVVTIFVLSIGILVTNIFWKDSGINNLLKSVFSEKEVVETDDRRYDDFDAVSPTKDLVEVENGVMTIKNGGAVYSPADGKVVSVNLIDGKYTVTIAHSDNYSTIISGADYSYVLAGDKVFTTTPVCYSVESVVEVAMYDSNSIITAFALQEGKIVWQN